jgi:hypothetical protein
MSVVAVAISLFALRGEHRRLRADERRRREQFAAQVTWWTTLVDHQGPDRSWRVAFHVNNANVAPAYHAVLLVHAPDGLANWDLGILPPGMTTHVWEDPWVGSRSDVEYKAIHNGLADDLYFADPQGRRWVRTGDGDVRESAA